MTDTEAEEFYDKLVKYFGESLPSIEHEPIRFRYYVKLYRYIHGLL